MKMYLGVKVVQAEPETRDGKDGYKVIYEEGYTSWCPKDVFEKHNQELDGMTFHFAMEAVKRGNKIARHGWNGKGMWIKLQVPDEHSKMTLPYLYIEYPKGSPAYPNGSRVPWLASQTDLLFDDWFVVVS
jgi:hypothetical protein